MSSYDISFLKEFATHCRQLECGEKRMDNAGIMMNFVHRIYDESLSGKRPTLPDHLPLRRNTPKQKNSEKFRENKEAPIHPVEISLEEDNGEMPFEEVLNIYGRAVFDTGLNILSGHLYGSVCNSTTFVSALTASLACFIPSPCYVCQGNGALTDYQAGCICSSPSFLSSLAASLASFTPMSCTGYSMEPGACAVELRVVNWFCSIIGYGKGSCGYLTSGPSSATVHAFMVARDECLTSTAKANRCVVYMSEFSDKANTVALNVVGLAKCQIRQMRVDDDFRMSVEALEYAIKEDIKDGLKPILVVGTAGTTHAGSVDPLISIAHVAKCYNLWFHVDATIGGVCVISDRAKQLMQGIELSDSVTLGCHDIFLQPAGLGAVLLRDGKKMLNCMSIEEPYYLEEDRSNYSPKDYTFEVTRPFRGLSLWFSLKLFGKEFLRKVIDEQLQLAQYASEQLNQMEHIKVYTNPDLMVILFRYESPYKNHDEINSEFLMKLQNQATACLNAVVFKGKMYLRMCVTAQRTHIQEIDSVIEEVKTLISRLK